MPLFSDTTSAIKSRFGFHDRTAVSSSSSEMSRTMPSVKSTPDLHLKSASKDTSAIVTRTLSGGGLDFDEDDHKTTSSNRSFEFREDPSFWKDHNVQVIIRIRPLSSSEVSVQGHSRCVRQESSQTVTWTGHPESRFTFDLVADENVSQEMLFKVAGVPMVENCMGGYNSCMFAYGQTGSGKTHTMLGDIEGGTRRHSVNCGMTPRVFEFLFSRIQKEREARREEKIKFTCRCSFLEIYNEQILDLLDPSSANLQIREDSKKGIYVENLTEVEVTSARDVIQQLLQGATNRKVAATNMNHASSRSHSVFTCTVESKWESQGVTHHRFARLNLVDLAGSERQKSSGAEGERLKEATNINKSLSTLGLVIMNLVNMSNGKSLHVPYRDSKLTFLLQDSLGGNAKTIVIANISPSSCCSLETLSTLKFAQRAKYIKNNAIVNEDASGDILAMRIQIQNLKKEVSRLRILVNGGAENHESDGLAVSFPGSPGTFKWEGLHGLCSPLISDKRMSQKKEYEVALVGAFRREKDKEIALRALVAENQEAMQLAKQREDEIQSLKMRLRFREAGIKRLEAVASGKISAETHLLQEKEEHLKEMEVLRSQVDRNKEATRFAMENLRLKEEIRRLKSFCEEGERERMNEQIATLQNKLLEALDWKLMHESDPSVVQNGNSETKISSGDDILLSGQDRASLWHTSINEENEFLRVQAIQNQSELDSLRKKLDLCLEEKEKLQRYVNDLEMQLEAEKSAKAVMAQETVKEQIELPSRINNQMPSIAASDQIELKTMVDAIAAASQREAEAHETAIFLSKENDELKMKLKVLLEDNNKLIELYEQAVAENNTDSNRNLTSEKQQAEDGKHQFSQVAGEDLVMKAEVENLKNQIGELHDENEKLMGLYEKAMHERDELKRLLAASTEKKNIEIRGEFNCPEKLVEIDSGDHHLKCDESFVSVDEKSRAIEADSFETHMEKIICPKSEEYAINGDEKSKAIEAGSVETQMEERIDPNSEEYAVSGDAEGLMEEAGLYEVNVQDWYTQCSDIKTDGPESEEFSCSKVKEVGENELSGQIATDEVKESALSSGGLISEECYIPEFSESSSSECHDNRNTSSGDQKSGTEMEIDARTDATTVKFSEDVVREKLAEAQEKLSSSAQMMGIFGSLERALLEVDELSGEIERLENGLHVKHQEYTTSKLLYSEMHERRVLLDRKLTALKYSLSSFSTSINYFEQREAQARARVNASTTFLDQKKDELAHLQVRKDEILDAKMKIKQAEVELKNHLADLKLKMEEETRRLENDRVLFAIDNVEKAEGHPLQRNWHLGGKATELLKSEEEKTKLQTQIKQNLERHGVMKKEHEDLKKKLAKVENEIHVVQKEIENGMHTVEDMNKKLKKVITEKEMVLDMKENGRNEFENMFIEYHQCLIDTVFKEEEMRILNEELLAESRKIEDLQREKAVASSRKSQLLEEISCQSCLVSDKVQEDLHSIRVSLADLAFGDNWRQ